MKTAEDWIRDNYGEHWLWSSCEWGSEDVIEAMEQYANTRLQELSLTDEEIQKWAKEVVIRKEDNYSGLDYMILAAKWARNKLTGK